MGDFRGHGIMTAIGSQEPSSLCASWQRILSLRITLVDIYNHSPSLFPPKWRVTAMSGSSF
jgi:hypothetical protein